MDFVAISQSSSTWWCEQQPNQIKGITLFLLGSQEAVSFAMFALVSTVGTDIRVLINKGSRKGALVTNELLLQPQKP